MAGTASYIKIAEGIRSNEISSKQKIENLRNEVSSVNSRIGGLQGRYASIEANISAEMSRPVETDSEGNTYGGPDYSAIAAMEAELGAIESEIDGLRSEKARLENEQRVEEHRLQEVLVEKAATLVEVQSKAKDAAASVAAAGGMVGAYAGIGATLASSFQNAHSNLAQAASILGGSVAGTSASGGGAGASRSAADIRGVPSQTMNMAVGITANGNAGCGRGRNVSSKRSATGASRGMSTTGKAKGSSTAGVFETAQTASSDTAFGFETADAPSNTAKASKNASKYVTNKTSVNNIGYNSILTKHLPSKSKGSWDGKAGDSVFSLNDNQEYSIDNKGNKMTGKQIRAKYGSSSVRYNNNDPDFSPFADNYIGIVKTKEEIPYLRVGNKFEKGTFDIANEMAAVRIAMTRDGLSEAEAIEHLDEYVKHVKAYMKEHSLTWHESRDLHTILPVPSAINKIFSHSGGISAKLDKQAASNLFREKMAGRSIKLSKGGNYIVDNESMHNAINQYKKELKQEKQRLKNFKVEEGPVEFSSDATRFRNNNYSYSGGGSLYQMFRPDIIKGLDKTRHGYQTVTINGKTARMYDDPANRTTHKIVFNQGSAWEGAPRGTCGLCACATIINMLGGDVTEADVLRYAMRSGQCRIGTGGTKTTNWINTLRDLAGIEAEARPKAKLRDLASEVESGRGVIIGVNPNRMSPDRYKKRGPGHAIAILSVIRDSKSNKILKYVIADSNGTSADDALQYVDASDMEKAYKKYKRYSMVTKQILR